MIFCLDEEGGIYFFKREAKLCQIKKQETWNFGSGNPTKLVHQKQAIPSQTIIKIKCPQKYCLLSTLTRNTQVFLLSKTKTS
jgi:hypothetical protein